MKEKDLILNYVEQIKYLLYEIHEEECSSNEGSLTYDKYTKLMELLINIEKERLLSLSFWGDDCE